MTREFFEKDVVKGGGGYEYLLAETKDLIVDEPQWIRQGLMETRSGYGARLNSGRKILFCGKKYRVYITQYSNAGTAWFMTRGRKIVVH